MTDPRQLYHATWDAAELMQRHPPRFGNRSKAAAFEHLMAAGGEVQHWGPRTQVLSSGRVVGVGHVCLSSPGIDWLLALTQPFPLGTLHSKAEK